MAAPLVDMPLFGLAAFPERHECAQTTLWLVDILKKPKNNLSVQDFPGTSGSWAAGRI